jgi:hypothetical protein
MSGTLTKQPNESRLYEMDFSNLLNTGETISTVDSVTQLEWDADTSSYVPTTDLTLGSPATNGTIAQVRISDGVDQKTYKVTFLVTTTDSNILESEGVLAVVDT